MSFLVLFVLLTDSQAIAGSPQKEKHASRLVDVEQEPVCTMINPANPNATIYTVQLGAVRERSERNRQEAESRVERLMNCVSDAGKKEGRSSFSPFNLNILDKSLWRSVHIGCSMYKSRLDKLKIDFMESEKRLRMSGKSCLANPLPKEQEPFVYRTSVKNFRTYRDDKIDYQDGKPYRVSLCRDGIVAWLFTDDKSLEDGSKNNKLLKEMTDYSVIEDLLVTNKGLKAKIICLQKPERDEDVVSKLVVSITRRFRENSLSCSGAVVRGTAEHVDDRELSICLFDENRQDCLCDPVLFSLDKKSKKSDLLK
ncbi:MAG: hypothetical protein HQM00_03835 [Magnetococcales bacterium]|nr:hypothetical protein [Magnetococcales bacterium]